MLTPEKLLERSTSTAHVLSHARLLLRLHQCFQRHAPSGLAAYAKVVNYRAGVIVIHASNGATAAKLKQTSLRMQRNFEEMGVECIGIEVKVQPDSGPESLCLPSTPKPISGHTAAMIRDQASHMPADSPLTEALQHLLERALIYRSE